MIRKFLKDESLLVASAVLALVSLFFTDGTADYSEHIDLKSLMLLFCFMACAAGLLKSGLFSILLSKISASRKERMPLMLVLTCFFSSMFITNDAALITFVPLTLMLLKDAEARTSILTVVMETVAANIGSMITPFGNPQNIFLYSYYEMSISDFFAAVLPYAAVGLMLILAVMYFIKGKINYETLENYRFSSKSTAGYLILFMTALLAVLGVIPCLLCFLIVAAALLIKDRKILYSIDYSILAVFLFFFIFSANISSIEWINSLITKTMGENGFAVSVLLSQIVSNVPAAITLAPFTSDSTLLLAGINIGGLGTPVASMASLISYRFYTSFRKNETCAYLKTFLAVNFLFLAVLLSVAAAIRC